MAEVRLEIALAHPRERVWRALTDARLLGEWLMPTDLAPVEGSRFTLEPGTLAGFLGQVSGELIELAPPHRMTMLWQGEKLHTRVVWELIETGDGCTLQVVQTGFIGAPAALRRRALRDTYTRLFGEQLPAVLDRLATMPPVSPAVAASPGLAVAAPVPRQRRVPGNAAVGAWAAGRTLTGPGPDAPAPAVAPVAPVAPAVAPVVPAVAPVVPAPRRSPESSTSPPKDPPAKPADPEWPYEVDPAPPGRLASAPAWARTLAIGVAAAGLVVAVLLAVVYVPGRDSGGEEAASGSQGSGQAPGAAPRPGETPPPESAEPPDPDAPVEAEGAPADGEAAVPGQSGDDGPAELPSDPDAPEAPADPASPDPAVPAPVLTAELNSTDRLVLGLLGQAVTVTVSNPGPAGATDWEVAMDVGDQEVSNVSGAHYAQDGPRAVFTPVGDELAAGASTQFSFDLASLLGADEPTGCTIDGRACG